MSNFKDDKPNREQLPLRGDSERKPWSTPRVILSENIAKETRTGPYALPYETTTPIIHPYHS